MLSAVRKFLKNSVGAAISEYSIIMALVAIAIMGGAWYLGQRIHGKLSEISSAIRGPDEAPKPVDDHGHWKHIGPYQWEWEADPDEPPEPMDDHGHWKHTGPYQWEWEADPDEPPEPVDGYGGYWYWEHVGPYQWEWMEPSDPPTEEDIGEWMEPSDPPTEEDIGE